MVKLRERTILTKEELARSLLVLAEQLVKGKISFQQIELEIPPNLEVKYKYKTKEGFSKFKLSFKWPDSGGVPLGSGNNPQLKARSVPNGSFLAIGSASYKELKKSFEAVLNSISSSLAQESIPSKQQIDELIKLTEASAAKSKPKLVKGMEATKKVVNDLKKAIEANNLDEAKKLVTALYQLKDRFHDQYK